MASTSDYYKQIMGILDKQVAELQSEFKRHLNCRQGCSSCCENVKFKISYIEALMLEQGFNSLDPGKQKQIIDNLESDSPHCPFLIEGSCASYQYRPALCRGYGLLLQVGNEVGTCSLNFNESLEPGESLKKLEMLPYYSILEELSEPLWQKRIAKSHANSVPINPDTRQSIRAFMNLLLTRSAS